LKPLFQKIAKWFIYAFAILIILAAMVVSIGTLANPYLNRHRADFEKWASKVLKTPVTIQKIELSWYYYEPVIDFNGVRILDSVTQQPTLQLAHLTIHLGIIQSIQEQRWVPDYIKISGTELTIQQLAKAQWKITGFGLIHLSDNTEQPNELIPFILAQPHLILDEIKINYIPLASSTLKITLNKLSLKIRIKPIPSRVMQCSNKKSH